MTIHQEVIINCPPDKVYRALTTASEFSEFTGAPAEIAAVEGGAFSCFDGQITGLTIELCPDEAIVQAWRVGAWAEHVYSIVRFDLHNAGAVTKVVLNQAGFPDDAAEHLEAGWYKMYWEPLQAYLGACRT